MERLSLGFREIKLATDGSTVGEFSGYGAAFGNEDAYGDVIEEGAFSESLKEWKARGKLPPMLLQHGGGFLGGADDMLPVGKWLDMREDSKGLRVKGQLFALDTERGRYIYEGLKEGVLDGLSIGFRTKEYRIGTKPGEPDRTLTNIDLWEVSIVTFPANPKARVSGVKTLTIGEVRKFEAFLRDEGFSHADTATVISGLRKYDAWRQRDAGAANPRDAGTSATKAADENVQALLSDLSRIGGILRRAQSAATVEASSRVAAILRG